LLNPIDDQIVEVFQTGFQLTTENKIWYLAPANDNGITYADTTDSGSSIEIKTDQSQAVVLVKAHPSIPVGTTGTLAKQPDGSYQGKVKVRGKVVTWVLRRINNPL
jgi:hypothetical protein